MHKSITTKTGDDGTTSLLYGGRRDKNGSRIELVGRCDEAIAAIGLARVHEDFRPINTSLRQIQSDLFIMGAELATSIDKLDDLAKNFKRIDEESVELINHRAQHWEKQVDIQPNFVIPGTSVKSAYMEMARVSVRRLERGFDTSCPIGNEYILPYLNRLSDVLFLMGQFQDKDEEKKYFTSGRKEKNE